MPTDRCPIDCDGGVASELLVHGDLRLRVCATCGVAVGVDVRVRSVDAATGRARRRCILIADPDPTLRGTLRDRLEAQGHGRVVVVATSGTELVEAFTRTLAQGDRADLLVLDVPLESIDGRDTAFAVRAVESALSTRKTPILFFSAVACDVPFKAMLEELGNAKYVRKSEDRPIGERVERIASVVGRLFAVRGA